MVKFLWNGIKEDNQLYKAWYSKGGYTPESEIPEESITIYAKDYATKFPFINELTVENDSDPMTDLHDKDKIVVRPSNKHYEDVLKALEMQETHREKLAIQKDWNRVRKGT